MNYFQKTFFKGIILLFIGSIFSPSFLKAQNKDTLRIMTYNVLNYRNTTNQCTNNNNNPQTKENALEIIIDHTLPDVLVCTEVGASPNGFNAFTLMNSSLNQNGRTHYTMANYTHQGFQDITNMLYYDTSKLVLHQQETINKDLSNSNLVRLIDIYTLYFKDPFLSVHNDTTFFHFIGAHLKAGNSSANRTERGKATEAVMAHLDTINASGNYFFMGDLNVYTFSEPAFIDLVAHNPDPSINFYDPVNRSGSWNNSSTYADVHTQSTRTSGSCAAGGGMDDRFDFILCSDEVLNGSDKVKYIGGTYQALGQDGNRFNGSIKSPTNSSVPFFVANALYDLSDHLPILMDLELNLPGNTGISEYKQEQFFFQNPVKDRLRISFSKGERVEGEMQLLDLSGRLILNEKVENKHSIEWNVAAFKSGSYVLNWLKPNGEQYRKKLIIF